MRGVAGRGQSRCMHAMAVAVAEQGPGEEGHMRARVSGSCVAQIGTGHADAALPPL